MLRQLDQLCPPQTIFVSHTSSLSIEKIARETEYPKRVAGLHFLPPIHLVKLVEVVNTSLLDPSVLESMCAFVQSLNKEPIVVIDSAGFVISRLIIAYLLAVHI